MKKIICIVFVIFYPFTTVNGAEITPHDILRQAVSGVYDAAYDINEDGKINSMDARSLMKRPPKKITSLNVLQRAASGRYKATYDINRDGKVNAMDALLLLRKRKSNQEVKYTYDTLDRLVRYECNRGTIEYKYDVCGNRTEIKSVP